MNCRSNQNIVNLIKKRCDGREKCEINVNNDVFGDPCPGIEKYLQVDYECIEKNAITTNQYTSTQTTLKTRITFPVLSLITKRPIFTVSTRSLIQSIATKPFRTTTLSDIFKFNSCKCKLNNNLLSIYLYYFNI